MGALPPNTADRRPLAEKVTATVRTVHICAASEDEKSVEALKKHLTGVQVTHAGDISPGEEWGVRRGELIEAAHVIVLLVSADYVASPEHRAETALALAQHDAKAARLVPVYCRAYDWESLPYANLVALPRDGRPVVIDGVPREGALREIAREIRAVLAGTVPYAGTREVRAALTGPPPRAGIATLPAIEHFVGRDIQVEELTRALLAEPPPRIIVLGSGGIGKTTLTLAALRRRDVEARYGERRWFVRLDAAATADAALEKIGEALGLSLGDDPLAEVSAALAKAAGVLVLDNLETPWEGEQAATEAMLGALAEIAGLALVASVRGAHKPAGVAWGKQIELTPLAMKAAEALFSAVAPKHTGDARVRPLLARLDGVPLAIVLLARAAEGDDLDNLTADWKARRTALLVRLEPDRLSSWAVSVELSMASKRMTPDARRLATVLARLLPGGIAVADLDAVFSGGRSAARVLSQVGLGFFEGGRLQMLAPIREHILLQHWVTLEELNRAIDHYGAVARELVPKLGHDCEAAVMARVKAETPNMRALLPIMSELNVEEYASAFDEMTVVMYALEDNMNQWRNERDRRRREETSDQLLRTIHGMLEYCPRLGWREYQARCTSYLGEIARARSDDKETRRWYEEALQLYNQAGDARVDVRGMPTCIFYLGVMAATCSEYTKAREQVQQAVLLFRQVGDATQEAEGIRYLDHIATLELKAARKAKKAPRAPRVGAAPRSRRPPSGS